MRYAATAVRCVLGGLLVTGGASAAFAQTPNARAKVGPLCPDADRRHQAISGHPAHGRFSISVSDASVVWGPSVVWGTTDAESVVWGTSSDEPVVSGTSCTDSACVPVVWNRP